MLAARRILKNRVDRTAIADCYQLPFNSTGWKYRAALQTAACATDGVEDTDLTWTSPTFDDSAWTTAQAPIGWGYHGGVGFTTRNTTITEQYELWMRYKMPSGSDWSAEIKVDNYCFVYFNGHKITGTLPSGAFTGADNGIVLRIIGSVTEAWSRPDFNVIALHVQDKMADYGPGDVLIGDAQLTAFPPGVYLATLDFTAADSSTPPAALTVASGTWAISSEQLKLTTSTAIVSVAYLDPGVGDYTITADVPTFWGAASNGGWGFVFRYTDNNNCYVADFGTTSPAVYKIVAGVVTNIDALGGSTLASGDTISVTAKGSLITVRRKRAGVTSTLVQLTDTTWDNTHHKCGFYAFGADTVSRFDNLRVTAA